MSSDEPAKDEPDAADTGEDPVPPAEDPNESTEGLLDERKLRAHAHEVDAAIQEATNRNA